MAGSPSLPSKIAERLRRRCRDYTEEQSTATTRLGLNGSRIDSLCKSFVDWYSVLDRQQRCVQGGVPAVGAVNLHSFPLCHPWSGSRTAGDDEHHHSSPDDAVTMFLARSPLLQWVDDVEVLRKLLLRPQEPSSEDWNNTLTLPAMVIAEAIIARRVLQQYLLQSLSAAAGGSMSADAMVDRALALTRKWRATEMKDASVIAADGVSVGYCSGVLEGSAPSFASTAKANRDRQRGPKRQRHCDSEEGIVGSTSSCNESDNDQSSASSSSLFTMSSCVLTLVQRQNDSWRPLSLRAGGQLSDTLVSNVAVISASL